MLIGLGDVLAVHQRVDRRVELAALGRAEALGERFEAGLADDEQRVDQLLAPGGDRDAAHAPVVGVLDPGGELALDKAVDRAAHRGDGDAEALGEVADLVGAGLLTEAAQLEQGLALGHREAGLLDHPKLVATVVEEDMAHQGAQSRRGVLGLLADARFDRVLDDRLLSIAWEMVAQLASISQGKVACVTSVTQ